MMNLPSWRIPWNALYGKEKGCVCDFSGTVVSPGHSDFTEGDEVFGLTLKPFAENGGALGEVADLGEGNYVAVKKPGEWSFEQAAGISLVWLTAKRNIESVEEYVEASKSKKVAVLGGSSATGIYSIILAKRKGWSVITTSSGRNKDFVVGTLGADEHVDYTTQNVREEVSKFEPEAVIDCVGGTECVGLPSSKRYTTIVGDKTSRTGMVPHPKLPDSLVTLLTHSRAVPTSSTTTSPPSSSSSTGRGGSEATWAGARATTSRFWA